MSKAASLSAGPGRVRRFPQAAVPQVILDDRFHGGVGNAAQMLCIYH